MKSSSPKKNSPSNRKSPLPQIHEENQLSLSDFRANYYDQQDSSSLLRTKLLQYSLSQEDDSGYFRQRNLDQLVRQPDIEILNQELRLSQFKFQQLQLLSKQRQKDLMVQIMELRRIKDKPSAPAKSTDLRPAFMRGMKKASGDYKQLYQQTAKENQVLQRKLKKLQNLPKEQNLQIKSLTDRLYFATKQLQKRMQVARGYQLQVNQLRTQFKDLVQHQRQIIRELQSVKNECQLHRNQNNRLKWSIQQKNKQFQQQITKIRKEKIDQVKIYQDKITRTIQERDMAIEQSEARLAQTKQEMNTRKKIHEQLENQLKRKIAEFQLQNEALNINLQKERIKIQQLRSSIQIFKRQKQQVDKIRHLLQKEVQDNRKQIQILEQKAQLLKEYQRQIEQYKLSIEMLQQRVKALTSNAQIQHLYQSLKAKWQNLLKQKLDIESQFQKQQDDWKVQKLSLLAQLQNCKQQNNNLKTGQTQMVQILQKRQTEIKNLKAENRLLAKQKQQLLLSIKDFKRIQRASKQQIIQKQNQILRFQETLRSLTKRVQNIQNESQAQYVQSLTNQLRAVKQKCIRLQSQLNAQKRSNYKQKEALRKKKVIDPNQQFFNRVNKEHQNFWMQQRILMQEVLSLISKDKSLKSQAANITKQMESAYSTLISNSNFLRLSFNQKKL